MQDLVLDVRRARPIALALALVAALGGCSGGDYPSRTDPPIGNAPPSGGPAPPPPPPPSDPPPPSSEPPAPTSNPETGGGIWLGTLSGDGDFLNWAMCFLAEAGELACVLSRPLDDAPSWFSDEYGVGAVHGTLRVSSTSQASGSGKIYATRGNVLTDGTSVVADFTITGGSLSRENRRLEFTFSSLGEESTFSLDFDHADYVVPVDSPPDGVYTSFEIFGDPASLSIDPNGALFLQTASGCSGNGQIVLNTPGYNAYRVDVTVSDCPGLDGAYEGLAALFDFDSAKGSDVLAISVFNETTAIVGVAVN